jgi:hypothetical protein
MWLEEQRPICNHRVVRKETLRMYLGAITVLALIAGISFKDGLQSWHSGDSSYWMAIVLVPACLGFCAFLSRKIVAESVDR